MGSVSDVPSGQGDCHDQPRNRKTRDPFQSPERLPSTCPTPTALTSPHVGMSPRRTAVPGPKQRRRMGRLWENIGVCNLGEVKEFPLKDWAEFDKLPIPNIRDPNRWGNLPAAREKAGDKFLLASRHLDLRDASTSSAASKTPGWTSTITRSTSAA